MPVIASRDAHALEKVLPLAALRAAISSVGGGARGACGSHIKGAPAGLYSPPHRPLSLRAHELSAGLAALGAARLAAAVGGAWRRPRHDPPPGARSVRHA